MDHQNEEWEGEYPHIDWGKVKPEVELLKEFEEELFKVPKKVKFKLFDNPLQKTMREDLKRVKNSGKVVVKADKTRNVYGVPPNTTTVSWRSTSTTTTQRSAKTN